MIRDDRVAKYIDLMIECGRVAEVARRMGVSTQAVSQALHRHGFANLIKPRRPPLSEVVSLAADGLSQAAIARQLNCQVKTVRAMLTEHGSSARTSAAQRDLRKQAIIALWEQDFAIEEIVEIVGVTRATVLHVEKPHRVFARMPTRHQLSLLHEMLAMGCSQREAAKTANMGQTTARILRNMSFISYDEGVALAKQILEGTPP